jgi:TRAP transporter TAXI family solute receptor
MEKYNMNKSVFFATLALAAFSTIGMSNATDINVCTGGSGGNYEYAGKLMKNQLSSTGINVNVINTKGSWENLEKMDNGECDAALVQSDAVYVYEKENGPVNAYSLGDMFTEYVHLLCRRSANIEDIDDLETSSKVYVGPVGSGSNVSFRGMIMADKEFGGDAYSKIPLMNEGADKSSLVKLKGGSADCMVYTAAPGTTFMTKEAQKFGDDLVLVPVIDKDFNDVTNTDVNGNKTSVWRPVTMSYKTYKTIMPSGVFGRKDVDTFGVNAQFLVSQKWESQNSDAFGEVGYYLTDVQNQLRADRKLEIVK